MLNCIPDVMLFSLKSFGCIWRHDEVSAFFISGFCANNLLSWLPWSDSVLHVFVHRVISLHLIFLML